MYLIINLDSHTDKLGEIALKVAPFGVPTSIVEKLEHACPTCKCHGKREIEQKAKVEEPPRVVITQPTPPPSVVLPPPPPVQQQQQQQQQQQPVQRQPVQQQPVPPPQQYQPHIVPQQPQRPFYARHIPVKEESADILIDYDSGLDRLLNPGEYVDPYDDQQEYDEDSMEADNSGQMFSQMLQNGLDAFGGVYGSANSTGASSSRGVTRKTGNTNRRRSNGENNEAGAKKKKLRHTFTEEQMAILLQHYNEDDSSGAVKLREIAQICGLRDKQVIDWFRNRKKRLAGHK